MSQLTKCLFGVALTLVGFELNIKTVTAQTPSRTNYRDCDYRMITDGVDEEGYKNYQIKACFGAKDRAVLTSRDPGSPINIRKGAGTNFEVQRKASAGDRVQVNGYSSSDDGYVWYEVRFIRSGSVGWVRGDFLGPVR